MLVGNFNISSTRKNKVLFFSLCLFLSSHLLFASSITQDENTNSSFTSTLINIEAPVNETFRYQTTLHNGSNTSKIYELKTTIPNGWRAAFKAHGSRVTSIKIDAGKKESISIEINPAYGASPSKYKIPIYATSQNDTLVLNVEAVVTGSYDLELTTPSGLLSGRITEGERKEINLQVKNTGTLALENISLSSQNPTKWEATFSPSEIPQLAAGQTKDVIVTLTVPDKTLAGDYINRFTAKTVDTTNTLTYRTTVETSVFAGWIGVVVILLAIGIVAYLIYKFGRR
ncbi:COG1470 family protein [Chondrinema litorale]|uniref:COG1470 family protein n=1 Tax=Chondrinema litorale TaxID=2994555 RepID=UPI002543EBC1|nr:NEW3 domain-containing protein [Chondrinema litorale]UZR99021.1 NEW3 domain-containing protein [Chondrinema litorale]